MLRAAPSRHVDVDGEKPGLVRAGTAEKLLVPWRNRPRAAVWKGFFEVWPPGCRTGRRKSTINHASFSPASRTQAGGGACPVGNLLFGVSPVLDQAPATAVSYRDGKACRGVRLLHARRQEGARPIHPERTPVRRAKHARYGHPVCAQKKSGG